MFQPVRRLTRPISAALIAATFALSTLLPAHAWQVQFTSEGCFAQGDSYQIGSSGTSVTEAVVSGTSNPCGYSYVSGDYYISGSWTFGLGPHWDQGGSLSVPLVANATHAVGNHSACNPGGTCPSQVHQYSQY